MEYIQCSHCRKKYSVNDSIRAATGKKIRCKGCDQTFEIIVLGGEQHDVAPKQGKVVEPSVVIKKTPPPSPQSTPSPIRQQTGQQSVKKKSKPKQSLEKIVTEKRKSRFVMIVIFLGLLVLIAMAGMAYLYVEKPELFESWSKQMYMEEEQIQVILDVSKEHRLKQPQGSKSIEATEKEVLGPALPTDTVRPSSLVGPPAPEPKRSTYRDMVTESKACREAAAQQWMVDYLISHMTYSGADYIQMLDQSSEHSASMRENCKDHALIHEITAAAREGKKPFWIQAAVDAMQKQQLDEAAGSAY